MPNLVGFQDASPPPSMEEGAKRDILVAMQYEALGIKRRDLISTTEFKENKADYVPTVYLESQRLVNKSSIGKAEKSRLEGWNNAWTSLQNDGSDSQNLRDVNEGKGQTHRAKLMSNESVREYTDEANFRGGGRAGKSGRGGHGGRGSSDAGRVTGGGGKGKAKGGRKVTFQSEVSVQPITRVRVPKGQHATAQTVPRHQPVPILKKLPAMTPAKVTINVPSVPATSTRPPARYDGVLADPSAFMASVGIRKEHDRIEPIKVAPSGANTTKGKAAGNNVGTSISTAATTTSTSNEKPAAHKPNTAAVDIPGVEKTIAAEKSMASVKARPKADLMDLDIGQETIQPVLQFTAPSTEDKPSPRVVQSSSSFDQQIEALEKSGLLSVSQLEVLITIQNQLRERENSTTAVKEAPRPGIYTKSELVSLRPGAAVPKVTTGIARKLAEQQNAFLIGEHVHKTRYHTAASLTEDFEKLSISDKELSISDKKPSILDKKPVNLATTGPPTTEKSKINPFGPPPAKSKGPSLPAHLLNQTPTADHGAAARVQYSGGNEILADVSNQQSPAGITSTARPIGRNMINQTGFIALAEGRVKPVAAGKKGEDPLLVARKRGL